MAIVPEPDTYGDRAFTLNETADRIGGVSLRHVYTLIERGELRALKLGSRTVVRQSEINRFLDALPAMEVS